MPTASLFGTEVFEDADALGRITGAFRLSGNAQVLEISELNAASHGTDLWHLSITGAVKNALNFGDVALNVEADIPSAADLLEALGLARVDDAGPVTLAAGLNSQGTHWETAVQVGIAASDLQLKGELDADDPYPVVRGSVESDLIQIDHLRDVIAATVELARLETGTAASDTKSGPADEDEFQPLVLNAPDGSEADAGDVPNRFAT